MDVDLATDYQYQYPDTHYEIVTTPEAVDSFYKAKQEIYEPVEGETIFIIARHGEAEANVTRAYDGRTLNLSLTEKGVKQGVEAGVKLKEKVLHIDHVITTSMCRTDQTAEEMLKAFPESQPSHSVDTRFLERYVGKYEGHALTELEFANKQDKKISTLPELTFEAKMRFSPEEGEIESYASIWERVHNGIQENGSALQGRVVLVVTHSGTMRSIFWHLTQKLGFFVPYANFKPDNGAFMIISVKDGEISLLETQKITILN
jgi:broad specificity phosphatase PhoE